MRAAVARRVRRDRRGLYLAIAGAGWVLYGVQVAADPRPGTVRGAAVLAELAPLRVWGWVWICCGAVALLASVSTRPAVRTVGFTMAEFPPLLWALGFAAAWLGGQYPQAWAGAATWASAALRLMVVAGWPDRTPVAGGEGTGG
ncbi:hypothetical protein ACIO6U_03665 [Streptomyces sp. NPDC087422]|uniref:hypothetical protein n=1 Tax=Streptomyces sp. NPDC087422 TaxID=3365786 RepID=UPI0037F9909B